jgi:hypothetical protein
VHTLGRNYFPGHGDIYLCFDQRLRLSVVRKISSGVYNSSSTDRHDNSTDDLEIKGKRFAKRAKLVLGVPLYSGML